MDNRTIHEIKNDIAEILNQKYKEAQKDIETESQQSDECDMQDSIEEDDWT